MSDKLMIAGAAVIKHLAAAEHASDASVQGLAALSVTVIEARQMAKLRAATGQRALSDLAEAQLHATKARSLLVRAHHRLAVDALDLGFDWTMFGDEADTPPYPEERKTRSEAVVD